jgi:hypothetical protein
VPCVHPSLQHLHKLHPTIPRLLSSLPHYREGNHEEPTQKVSMFVHLTTEQFTTLLDCYQKQQANISAFLHHHTPLTSVCSFPSSSSNSSTLEMKLGDFYKITNFEDMSCFPILLCMMVAMTNCFFF